VFQDGSTDRVSTFVAKFGGSVPSSPGDITYGTKSKAELLSACNSDGTLSGSQQNGVSWTELTNGLDSLLSALPTNTRTQIKTKIQSETYAVVGIRKEDMKVVVVAAFKEE